MLRVSGCALAILFVLVLVLVLVFVHAIEPDLYKISFDYEDDYYVPRTAYPAPRNA